MNQLNFKLALGWDEHFESHYLQFMNPAADPSWIAAKVIGEERGAFRLQTGPESIFWGELSGKARYGALSREDLPATGDWVVCAWDSKTDSRAIIHGVLPRKTCLIRKEAGKGSDSQILASNVDIVFLVMSLNADLNPRRLERYLALVWDSGARPVILLTKADLVENAEMLKLEIESVAPGVDVHAISVYSGEGMDFVRAYLRSGLSVVLLGSSGVGKSTLANHLLGEALLRTQEIREDDSRGRHTTTSRYLFVLPDGGMLIDTPGMRELALQSQGEGVETLFEDLLEVAARCRFSDCRHQSEPDCAIRAAVESGELDPERLASFDKLQREIAYQERRSNKALESEEKKRWKKLGAMGRERGLQKRRMN